jgi:hypothetical protein
MMVRKNDSFPEILALINNINSHDIRNIDHHITLINIKAMIKRILLLSAFVAVSLAAVTQVRDTIKIPVFPDMKY